MPRENDLPSNLALLGLLINGPRHGYELNQEFNRGLGRVWRIGLSQLYAQFKDLEDAGLTRTQTELQPNRPARKVYHLTPAGEAAFLAWLHQPTPYIGRLRFEFLARVYFFQSLGLPGLEVLVANQRAICESRLQALAKIEAQANEPFERTVLQFRQSQLEAVLSWLERCFQNPEI